MLPPDRARLISLLTDSNLKQCRSEILTLLDEKYANPKHGHFVDWQNTFESLPELASTTTDLSQDSIVFGDSGDITQQDQSLLEEKLKELNPWRKGPFIIFGIHVDTEWRSDWKWSRIAPHIDLQDKLVLDIGCGNGYYALRMQALGAKLILGVDPSWHYAFQFHALQKYSTAPQQAFVLPFSFEELPVKHAQFDSIFSMGVLYHRQEPRTHLKQVFKRLAKGGQLILETLIIDDPDADVLIPNERYANMRNVWIIPSIKVLTDWLSESGFVDIQVLDTTMTTVEEQRQTEWMTRYSLAQALDPKDSRLTIEGYQAPLRATILATK